ncbi:MAG: glycosyltransferase family 4 protein [Tepidisphaeraceae bacterium]
MRVINVHNHHVLPGGMEVLFASITNLLRSRGHDVITLERQNKDLRGLSGKLRAFGSMVYSPSAKREMTALLKDQQPSVVHVHNLYPQLSPSIIDACADAGVPVVMSIQDYKLTCPTAQHLRDGTLCEKCVGGHEQWCAIHNCRGSRPMSVAYALRNAATRVTKKVHRGVSAYLCCSQFVANQHIKGGFPADRVKVLYNFADLPDAAPRESDGDYAAYIGRISPEKGLDVLIDAARRTGLPVKIAGDPVAMPELLRDVPANVQFVGKLSRDAVPEFLRRARYLVVPSVWWEAFGIVCAEAMAYRLPVIATAAGGLPEVVDHGVTGLTVPMRDGAALAEAMTALWNDPAKARAMGEAGRVKALREYSPDVYYQRLIEAYRSVGASMH